MSICPRRGTARRVLVALCLLVGLTAHAREERIDVRRSIRSGQSLSLPGPASEVTRVEVRARRADPNRRENVLTLSSSSGRPLEGAEDQQVDRQDLHTLTWNPRAEATDRSGLRLSPQNGDVYVESVRIVYAAGAGHAEADPVLHQRVQRKLRAGESVTLRCPAGTYGSVEARVRRLDPRRTDTVLTLEPGAQDAQVDRQEYHTLTWTLGRGEPSRGEIVLRARNGDVEIDVVDLVPR